MNKNKKEYNKIYDFTNENVACLKDLYHFENSKVLSVVGSGDQFFVSVLNGAKKVDLFDINPTSYLYFLLKFYAIRELKFGEFYDFFITKNINNLNIYIKLEPVLPKEALKYYKYLIQYTKTNKEWIRLDGINLLSKSNQKYYFKNNTPIIPYFYKENYYKLQNLLKSMELPKFYNCDVRCLKKSLDDKYDVLLLSNIYHHISTILEEYTNMLNNFDIPEIQACYDWHGWYLQTFRLGNYEIDSVVPSSPTEYSSKNNYIYSLRK